MLILSKESREEGCQLQQNIQRTYGRKNICFLYVDQRMEISDLGLECPESPSFLSSSTSTRS